MPQKSETITVAGYDAAKILAIAYGAFQQIGWTVKYAGENVLIAYTPRKWNKYDNQITVNTADDQLDINSKMIHGEAFDIRGRNKKFITEFLAAFETVKAQATDQHIGEWNEKIAVLQAETIKIGEQQQQEAKEIDAVMNLSKGNLYVTYSIIAVNVIVFVAMVASGVSVFEPTGIDIIHWGANFGPLTLTGDWWRLLSCVFVHIGIVHILFNMYALYVVGSYLERMLGKRSYIIAYLCTGVFASLASLWWHKVPVPSAGASGAIFGLYGVFLALLSTNLIPKQIRNGLLQSIVIFVVYNLAYGMKSGVDNSAHVGGLVSGLAIGYLYYLGLKSDKKSKKMVSLTAAVAIVTIAATILFLESNKETPEARNKIKEEVDNYSFKDADRFDTKYDSIIALQKKALAPLNDTTLSNEQVAEQITTISLPEWDTADRLVKELKTYNVSEKKKQKVNVMQRYIDMRKEQISLILKFLRSNDEKTNAELDELNRKIGQTVDELDSL